MCISVCNRVVLAPEHDKRTELVFTTTLRSHRT